MLCPTVPETLGSLLSLVPGCVSKWHRSCAEETEILTVGTHPGVAGPSVWANLVAFYRTTAWPGHLGLQRDNPDGLYLPRDSQ